MLEKLKSGFFDYHLWVQYVEQVDPISIILAKETERIRILLVSKVREDIDAGKN